MMTANATLYCATLCCALLALAAGLSACSRDDPPPRPATTAKPLAQKAKAPVASKDPHAPLMQAVFGADYLPAKGYAIEGGAAADVPGADMPLIQTAATSMRLPSGDTALVVEGSFRRPPGEELMGEIEGAPVHMYLLRQQGGKWHVLRKHENIAEKGRNGTDLRWVTLGPDKSGLAIEDHWLGQGYMATWLMLFDPTSDRVVNLIGERLRIRSDNVDTCMDRCWSGEAKWRIDPGSGSARNVPYDDLVLEITGEETLQPAAGTEGGADDASPPRADAAAPAEKRSLAGTARYVFGNGKYRLQEGTNTLPSF